MDVEPTGYSTSEQKHQVLLPTALPAKVLQSSRSAAGRRRLARFLVVE